jgi:hypothetical protein
MVDGWIAARAIAIAGDEHSRFRQLVEDIGLVDYWRKSGWPEVCQPAGESFTCQ